MHSVHTACSQQEGKINKCTGGISSSFVLFLMDTSQSNTKDLFNVSWSLYVPVQKKSRWVESCTCPPSAVLVTDNQSQFFKYLFKYNDFWLETRKNLITQHYHQSSLKWEEYFCYLFCSECCLYNDCHNIHYIYLVMCSYA